MKTGRPPNRSATARLNQAVSLSAKLHSLTGEMQADWSALRVNPQKLQEARGLVADLSQAIHEFNAYSNVILGDYTA